MTEEETNSKYKLIFQDALNQVIKTLKDHPGLSFQYSVLADQEFLKATLLQKASDPLAVDLLFKCIGIQYLLMKSGNPHLLPVLEEKVTTN